jgi:hypothetical protein
MVAPMGIFMLATMGKTYVTKPLDVAVYGGLSAVFIAALAGTRTQTLVDALSPMARRKRPICVASQGSRGSKYSRPLKNCQYRFSLQRCTNFLRHAPAAKLHCALTKQILGQTLFFATVLPLELGRQRLFDSISGESRC